MSVFGSSVTLVGLLVIGSVPGEILPWAFRAIGESLADLRHERLDEDLKT